jgi:hypothetical protein
MTIARPARPPPPVRPTCSGWRETSDSLTGAAARVALGPGRGRPSWAGRGATGPEPESHKYPNVAAVVSQVPTELLKAWALGRAWRDDPAGQMGGRVAIPLVQAVRVISRRPTDTTQPRLEPHEAPRRRADAGCGASAGAPLLFARARRKRPPDAHLGLRSTSGQGSARWPP